MGVLVAMLLAPPTYAKGKYPHPAAKPVDPNSTYLVVGIVCEPGKHCELQQIRCPNVQCVYALIHDARSHSTMERITIWRKGQGFIGEWYETPWMDEGKA